MCTVEVVPYTLCTKLFYYIQGVQICFDFLKYLETRGENSSLFEYRTDFEENEDVILITREWWKNQKEQNLLQTVEIGENSIWIPLLYDKQALVFDMMILDVVKHEAYLYQLAKGLADTKNNMHRQLVKQVPNKCINVGTGSHIIAFATPACRIFPNPPPHVNKGGKPNHDGKLREALKCILDLGSSGFDRQIPRLSLENKSRHWSKRVVVVIPAATQETKRNINGMDNNAGTEYYFNCFPFLPFLKTLYN